MPNNYLILDVMKFNKLNLILVIVIALLIGVIVFNHTPNEGRDKYAKQKQEIDSLSKLITNLEKDQLRYDSLITSYKDSLIVMDHQIDSTKHEIKQIQNYYGKKIKNLSGATHTELTDFFADRYK